MWQSFTNTHTLKYEDTKLIEKINETDMKLFFYQKKVLSLIKKNEIACYEVDCHYLIKLFRPVAVDRGTAFSIDASD